MKIENIPVPFIYGEFGPGVTVVRTERPSETTIRLFFDGGGSITETAGAEFVKRRRRIGTVYAWANPPRDR